MTLTQKAFTEYKADYDVYGTHLVTDRYNSEQAVKDTEPKGTVHTMWHPLTDAASIAEYGVDVNKMFYAILYDDPGIEYGDLITLHGHDYEVVGIKYFNTHTRVDVRRKKV